MSGRAPTSSWPSIEIANTYVVGWNIDDPTKSGDGRYWWTVDQVERMAASRPNAARILAGTPKGIKLATARDDRAENEPLPVGIEPVLARFVVRSREHLAAALVHWKDADPEKTWLSVFHFSSRAGGTNDLEPPHPPAIAQLRQDWLAAVEAYDPASPALRKRFDEALAANGYLTFGSFCPVERTRAIQIGPGVFVQDD